MTEEENDAIQIERDIAAAERQLDYLECKRAKHKRFENYTERRFVRNENGKLTEVKQWTVTK